jgi:hypothetical protein
VISLPAAIRLNSMHTTTSADGTTIAYDRARDRWRAEPPIMHSAAEALVKTLPNGRRLTLAGQGHDISAGATAAALQEFLSN